MHLTQQIGLQVSTFISKYIKRQAVIGTKGLKQKK